MRKYFFLGFLSVAKPIYRPNHRLAFFQCPSTQPPAHPFFFGSSIGTLLELRSDKHNMLNQCSLSCLTISVCLV